MSDENKPPQPPEKATVKDMQAVPVWAIALQESFNGVRNVVNELQETQAEVVTTVHQIKSGLANVTDQANALSSEFYKFQGETRQRFETHSMRVVGESKTNLTQDAAISTLITDVADIKKDLAANTALSVEIKTAIAGALKSDTVKKLGYALAAAALAGLSYATAYFQAKGH